ncbi:MAG: transposase family protein [Oscillospiraceae bacterium]
MILVLIAIICGATSYARIELFGKNRREWLEKYLKLENGIPDANTFRYVMLKITPSQIHELFAEWMKSVIPSVKASELKEQKIAMPVSEKEREHNKISS